MALRRWDPWRELMRMQDEMSRMFERAFGRPEEAMEVPWMPTLDIYEKEDKFIATVELPDVNPDDIDVSVVDNTLRITGERKHTKEAKRENYFRSERFYGKFERMVELPVAVRTEEVDATYKDGLLTVSLPKAEERKAKEIKVKVA